MLNFLPSSSTIVTTASAGSTTEKSSGGQMLRVKVSFSSNIASLVIEISNEALIVLGGNITLYGPESKSKPSSVTQ